MKTRGPVYQLAMLMAFIIGTSSLVTQGQVSLKTGYGVIERRVLSGDSATLEINEYRGALQWQNSENGTDWTDCQGETCQEYRCKVTKEVFIRVAVASENCDPVLSDVVHYTTFNLPTVKTTAITEATLYAAKGGGEVTNDGGEPVTARGVCWSSKYNPTLANADSLTVDGSGTGVFTSALAGLSGSTHYYVRAYATNSGGTAYGPMLGFNTVNETGTFTDSRDNHSYKWVKIGTQSWMAENLAYLPGVFHPSNGSDTEARYYVHSNFSTNLSDAKANARYATGGALYNWPAAHGACPTGWHLPSNEELSILVGYLRDNGYSTESGSLAKSLASKNGWTASTVVGSPGNDPSKNNSSGINAFPGGGVFELAFWSFGAYCGFWSDDTEGIYWAKTLSLTYNAGSVPRNLGARSDGLSVRCVKD